MTRNRDGIPPSATTEIQRWSLSWEEPAAVVETEELKARVREKY
jgi:hypothetical protein